MSITTCILGIVATLLSMVMIGGGLWAGYVIRKARIDMLGWRIDVPDEPSRLPIITEGREKRDGSKPKPVREKPDVRLNEVQVFAGERIQRGDMVSICPEDGKARRYTPGKPRDSSYIWTAQDDCDKNELLWLGGSIGKLK